MVKRRSLEVGCQCGEKLARYKKGGNGRLVKMFLERIALDYHGIFVTEPPLELHSDVSCPSCEKRVATIQVIRGKYAAKVNQGAIQY